MPTTKKESLQFGVMMCFGMVLLMTVYNYYLNGMIGKMTIMEGLSDFLIGFVIALILDMLIVGPNAKKIALKITANTKKKIYTVLAISICMVIGMAFFMSIYGLVTTYIHNGFTSSSVVKDYVVIFSSNLIMALPLQIIIMGPFVRFIFSRYIKSTKHSELRGV
ncbi:DUF2798 domain-containing protein [Ornithinibacillus sp. BX22]|uniref:DUF2798 domain-containing protein n=2 Tax=Ornithinibacillus TaxID=484508 RepID=A0A923L904_9BACI|nr:MULTISPECIES: DUF2798 domain-containing protein [Ornithinibacillus]MBC5638760.1 DUF2798 domain-containing protein [Ornithinibacillus hominis]MBS3679881.1 DUF2798 domain-containing protein [Ornithinibacillus massiliensis]